MKNLLRILKKTENRYNLLVQLDYLVGLYTAFLLGAEKWSMFLTFLGVSLILGFLTVKAWARTVEDLTRKGGKT
jgi:hypothetical protein